MRLRTFLPARADPNPTPTRATYVVGDIHGRADLLAKLLPVMEKDAVPGGTADFVFLGDYVDRGPDAHAVIARLVDLSGRSENPCTFLMGNHERMLLNFIDNPVGEGPRWLRHGGRETLMSYGVKVSNGAVEVDDMLDLAHALLQAMPAAHLTWLRGLGTSWQSGNLICAHAAVDPAFPLTLQDEKSLLWGNADFHKHRRTDDLWVVHGHTVVDAPQVTDRRISVDTGAYFTGRLTAAVLAPSLGPRFITT